MTLDVDRRGGPPSTGRSTGGSLLILVVTLLILTLVIGVGWYLISGSSLSRFGRPVQVTIGISATPDATGTKVEMVAESDDGDIPAVVTVDLTRRDDATLLDGGSATGRDLVYSDVTDTFGTVMPADQVRSARLTAVATNGQRLRLSFHVAAVDGHRVVYPIPRIEGLAWVRARLYVLTGRVACWANGADDAQTGRFRHCPGGTTDQIDGGAHTALRLELTG
jgi:hypothetical protein